MKRVVSEYILLLMISSLALFSCSEPSNTKIVPGTGPASTDYRQRGESRKSQIPAIFPHPDDFESGSVHGSYVFPPGSLASCLPCHDGSRGSTTQKPCSECHEISEVHTAEYMKVPANHSRLAITSGYRKSCVRCHGSDLKGGKSGLSCYRSECHSEKGPFPHTSDMRDGKSHGSELFRYGLASCLPCHQRGSAKEGKNSCYDCHDSDWVHTAEEFADPTLHREAAISKGSSFCKRCHGEDLKGGRAKVSCQRSGCHNAQGAYPHTKVNFSSGRVHGAEALDRGYGECFACHGKEAAKKRNIKGCYDCHDGKEIHTKEEFEDPAVHAKVAVEKNYRVFCARCHGQDLKGGRARASCSGGRCHDTGSFFPHPSNYKSGNLHGRNAYEGGYDNCLGCHSHRSAGQPKKVPCLECHRGFEGHDRRDFAMPEIHGRYAVKNNYKQNCRACHDLSLSGERGLKSCSGKGCHEPASGFPHKDPNWAGDLHKHGDFARDNGYNLCLNKYCHPTEDAATGSGTRCHDCHQFPHPEGWVVEEGGSHVEGVNEGCSAESCHGVHAKKQKEVDICADCHG